MTSIITQGDNGPTLEELTKKLRKEVGTAVEAQDARAAEAEREKMFKGVGGNEPCPCGSGKKFKKCCGASAVAAERAAEERRNPNWVPEGVTATEDDAKGAWVCPRPKWITRLPLRKTALPKRMRSEFSMACSVRILKGSALTF